MKALVPSGVPLLAATATITPNIRSEIVDKLDMKGCKMVSVSPDRLNIYYDMINTEKSVVTDLLCVAPLSKKTINPWLTRYELNITKPIVLLL